MIEIRNVFLEKAKIKTQRIARKTIWIFLAFPEPVGSPAVLLLER